MVRYCLSYIIIDNGGTYILVVTVLFVTELSTGRMDPRVGSGRVGSGRVTTLSDFGGSGRVGSALWIFKFFTDYFLVPKSM